MKGGKKCIVQSADPLAGIINETNGYFLRFLAVERIFSAQLVSKSCKNAISDERIEQYGKFVQPHLNSFGFSYVTHFTSDHQLYFAQEDNSEFSLEYIFMDINDGTWVGDILKPQDLRSSEVWDKKIHRAYWTVGMKCCSRIRWLQDKEVLKTHIFNVEVLWDTVEHGTMFNVKVEFGNGLHPYETLFCLQVQEDGDFLVLATPTGNHCSEYTEELTGRADIKKNASLMRKIFFHNVDKDFWKE